MFTYSKVKLLFFTLIFFMTNTVYASQTGLSMPWDGPLKVVQSALTGTTAHIAIVIAIALAGLGFAFGEHGGLFRKGMGIIFGGSIAVGAASFYTTLQIGGALL
jgi:type IV secretory pathway VirB2 component (pilin)